MRPAVAILVGYLCGPGLLVAEPPAGGFLTGRVVGPDGTPIPAATVGHGTGRGSPLITATSGPDGRFKLGPLPPKAPSRFETLDLYADAPGLARQYVLRPAVIPGVANDVGDVRLVPGMVISGRVAAPANQPLGGVTVNIEVGRSDVGGRTDFGPPLVTFTDADGRYETPPLPPGQHWLLFRAGGRENVREEVEVRPGIDVKFPGVTLEHMLDVSGTVVDDRGNSVEGADVGGSNQRTLTDREGRYTLAGYGTKDTNVRLTVRKPGYSEAEVTAGAVKPRVVLRPVGGFDCRVVDAVSGEPVVRWAAALERVADGKPAERVWSSYGRTAEPGRWVVYAPDLGTFRLYLRADGYDTSDWVNLPPLTERKMVNVPVFRMRKTDLTTHSRVEGVAERGGKPIANGWAALYLPYDHPGQPVLLVRGRVVPPVLHFRSEVPVHDGRFTLLAPRAGEDFTVGVFEANRPPIFLTGVAVKAGQATKLKLTAEEPGAVKGVVPSWPANSALHLRVVAFNGLGFTFEAPVAGDGMFQFPALPPGEYGLKVGHDSYQDPDRPARPVGPAPDPWVRAKRVRVKPGEMVSRVELEITEK